MKKLGVISAILILFSVAGTLIVKRKKAKKEQQVTKSTCKLIALKKNQNRLQLTLCNTDLSKHRKGNGYGQ